MNWPIWDQALLEETLVRNKEIKVMKQPYNFLSRNSTSGNGDVTINTGVIAQLDEFLLHGYKSIKRSKDVSSKQTVIRVDTKRLIS